MSAATLTTPIPPPFPRADHDHDSGMNTIPDPRTPSPQPRHASLTPSRTNSSTDDGEVAVLTTKLINAMNHQSSLDDSLQRTRHELDQALEKVRKLEAENGRHQTLLRDGSLVKRADVEATETNLRNELAEERERRITSEKGKDKMERELEELSANLFTQANNMVAQERLKTQEQQEAFDQKTEALKAQWSREVDDLRRQAAQDLKDATERHKAELDELRLQSDRTISHLRSQLQEGEDLLKQHQAQLTDLKGVMQAMSESRVTTQQTPVLSRSTSYPVRPTIRQPAFDAAKDTAFKSVANPQSLSTPSTALTLLNLLQPVLRTDLASFDDFLNLLRTCRTLPPTSLPSPNPQSTSAPGSRVSSGNYSAMAHAIGLTNPPSPTTASSSSPTLYPSNPDTLTPGSQLHHQLLTSALKDSKFYKRVLTEDIEPTLRLDLAPGLSFFARRTVISALAAGTLVVEPFGSHPTSRNASLSGSKPGTPTPSGNGIKRRSLGLLGADGNSSSERVNSRDRRLTHDSAGGAPQTHQPERTGLALGLSSAAEKFLPRNQGPVHPCALCGENRKVLSPSDKGQGGSGYTDESYARRHCFRVSEEGERTRYPLCGYCVARVRAAAELVAFLRRGVGGHLTNGYQQHQTAPDPQKEREVACRLWEECVRLREKMFWARIGGGVVPKLDVEVDGSPEIRLDNSEAKDLPIRRSHDSARTGSSGETLDRVVEDRAVEEKGERKDKERGHAHSDYDSSRAVSPSSELPAGYRESEPVSPLEETTTDDVKVPGGFGS